MLDKDLITAYFGSDFHFSQVIIVLYMDDRL